MSVDESNTELGRNAMMHASFFYYQLLDEGEFSCGQTSYWLFEECTCWELLDFRLNEPKGVQLGIDPEFIREAAAIYVLCILLNQFEERKEDEYPKEDAFILQMLRDKGLNIIQEIALILDCTVPLDNHRFTDAMAKIYEKYVRGRFAKLIN